MQRHRLVPQTPVDLSSIPPRDRSGFQGTKEEARAALRRLNLRLRELQELLYAQGKHSLLMVLQGMDTGGKDGTIRHVFRGVNPQGVKVANFKVPSSRERAHDYLWRIHPHAPGRGEMAIFNRSHYEDVLVVRVRELAPEAVWRRRFDHINDFERMLSDEGITIVKFFLHISKEEQRERLQARLDEPDKRWKFSVGDLAERKLWDDYQAAYTEMLERTTTEWAPWHVVPADRKWYRNLVVATTLVETLERLEMRFPEPELDLDGLVVE
ncbi:MAG: polyphosphate kinase 2 family protein [Gemmatimonadota bacterium]